MTIVQHTESHDTTTDTTSTTKARGARRSKRFGLRLGALALVAASFLAVTGGSAGAATGTTAYHQGGRVQCTTFPGRGIEIANPGIRAVNRTSAVDKQWVAYKPVIFRWNGSAWAYYAEDGWMRGVASDNANPTIWTDEGSQQHYAPLNFGRTVPAGHYRVAIKYHWYAIGSAGVGDDYVWDTNYRNPNGTTSASYCTVP